ncbi:MAG TPA: hypothetical protein PLM16_00240 [Candidatus Woesebacteria bacterium]|nr:hypothetical protein [Candidatus Woesebacteria bacterium]
MTQYLPYIFGGSIIVLVAIMVVVGVQLFLVLREFRLTIIRLNQIADQAGTKIKSIGEPLGSLVGIATGVKTGIKVFEGFMSYLNRKKSDKEE